MQHQEENLTMLYTLKGKNGAYFKTGEQIAHHNPDPTNNEETLYIKMQMIGAAGYPESVKPEEIELFTLDRRLTEADPADAYTRLAQEAVTVYGLDGKRTHRATEIVRASYAIQPAKRDENNEPITRPSYKKVCVKGSKGWYVVTQGSCTCPDHRNGHTCKHRIAAWMQREAIARPLAAARKVSVKEIIAEVMS